MEKEAPEIARHGKATDYITFVIVVSAFAVLTLHTNNCFWFYTGKEDFWFSANIIECVFYFAVPLFFMVSGITLMDFFDRYSMKRFFARRFMKTMLPFLVWSLVAMGIDLYTGKRVCLLEGFINDWYQGKTLGTWQDTAETTASYFAPSSVLLIIALYFCFPFVSCLLSILPYRQSPNRESRNLHGNNYLIWGAANHFVPFQ